MYTGKLNAGYSLLCGRKVVADTEVNGCEHMAESQTNPGHSVVTRIAYGI